MRLLNDEGEPISAAPRCTTPTGRHHRWQRTGGLRENPGVWSVGGTALVFAEVCPRCLCERRIYRPGVQERRRGEQARTTYEPAWVTLRGRL
jgi:hypothetical protein